MRRLLAGCICPTAPGGPLSPLVSECACAMPTCVSQKKTADLPTLRLLAESSGGSSQCHCSYMDVFLQLQQKSQRDNHSWAAPSIRQWDASPWWICQCWSGTPSPVHFLKLFVKDRDISHGAFIMPNFRYGDLHSPGRVVWSVKTILCHFSSAKIALRLLNQPMVENDWENSVVEFELT